MVAAMLGDAEALRDDVLRKVLSRIDPSHLDEIACAMTDLRTAVEAEVTDPASTIHAHATQTHAHADDDAHANEPA